MAPSVVSSVLVFVLVVFTSGAHLASTNSTAAPETSCEWKMSKDIPKAVIRPDDSAWDPEEGISYPSGTYWKWEGEGSDRSPSYRGCPCLVGSRPCIRKCCLMGESVGSNGDCVSKPNPFTFEVTDQTNGSVYNVSGEMHFALLFGNPCTSGRYMLEPDNFEEDEFFISEEGFLFVPHQNMSDIGPDTYCFDYLPSKDVYIPMICFPPTNVTDDLPSDQLIYTMYPIGMLVSIPFLLVTFLVYALIPELRNLHGKSLMCHVSSLLTAYTFLAVVQLGGMTLSDGICIASAFIIEFSFLATFFWLNIMCFDICLTFSGLRPLRGSLRERERKKFLIYSLYAWGCPFVVLLVCIIMDFAPGIPETSLRPRFGEKKCWFSGKMETFVYFFGPVAVLVVCNVILFIITAVKLIHLKRETAMLKKGESKRHDDHEDRNRFNLYLKLLIVMGVNWVAELVSWAAGGPGYLWYLTDIGNTLQGFFIFLIFVWKDKIRGLLMQKFCPSLLARRRSRGSWYPWRSISPSKSSMSGPSVSTALTCSTVQHPKGSIKLAPLLNSPNTNPSAQPV